MKFKSFLVSMGLLALSCSAIASNNTHQYTVDDCTPVGEYKGQTEILEYNNDIDFCAQENLAVYKKFSEKHINFAKNFVLVRLNKVHYSAYNPKTKQVFVMPFVIFDSNFRQAKLSFSKNGTTVCSYGEDVEFAPYSINYQGGDSSDKNYKLCVNFDPKNGFEKKLNVIQK